MTEAEFKQAYPECAHLEGDELWNAMEDKMLLTQEGDKILRQSKPFWKRYRLRWLYYPKVKGWDMGMGPQYTQSRRCNKCKIGVGTHLVMMGRDSSLSYCPKCGPGLVLEDNKNLDHRLWSAWKAACHWVFVALNFLHIRRYGADGGRYSMSGDERGYVKLWRIGGDGTKPKYELLPRKRWEHIFIKR